MNQLEEVRQRFGNDRFATDAAGITVTAVGEKYAKCELALGPVHKNANGHVMGGVFFTLADFTFAIATNMGDIFTVTTTAQISFLSVPRGKKLIAESKLLKDGSTQCFYEVNVSDETGRLLAVVSICGTHVPPEKIGRK